MMSGPGLSAIREQHEAAQQYDIHRPCTGALLP